MKYVYINNSENRIASISNKIEPSLDADENLICYAVPDDFDMTKEIEGEILEGFLTPDEFLTRRNSDYAAQRAAEYPSINDQLDKIYHEGIDAWKSDIKSVKDKFPKT